MPTAGTILVVKNPIKAWFNFDGRKSDDRQGGRYYFPGIRMTVVQINRFESNTHLIALVEGRIQKFSCKTRNFMRNWDVLISTDDREVGK